MKINEFSPHLQAVLREMCSRVDTDPAKIDFKADTWYMEHEWTQQQETDFVEWLAQYFYANTEARKEILHANRKNLKYCRKAATEFVWNYGWKTKLT